MAPASCARALAASLLCASLAAAGVFLNPVIADLDTPDPGVAFDTSTQRWWAATTTGGGPDYYALHSSADLGAWRSEGFIFPRGGAQPQPSWIATDCWAPELHFVAGRWLAVYVGRAAATGLLSIGVGWSTTASPAGPWVDSGAPLITDSGADAQGQIDPTLVVDGDGGGPLLVFKEDGNFDGKATPFHYARLVANGTALVPGQNWKATSLLDHTLPWEGALVEAPWLVRGPGGGGAFAAWYLFYSGNGFGSDYAVGVARSDALLGPYEKHGDAIVVANAVFNNVSAHERANAHAPHRALTFASPHLVPPAQPGHCSVVPVGGGDTAIVYHAYLGADRSARHMMLDAVQWNATSGWPMVAGGAPSGGGFLPLPHAR